MASFILIVSAVFPPEPVVSGRLSMDLFKALKLAGQMVRVIHPQPSRPFGFRPSKDMTVSLGNEEIITDSYVCPQSSISGRIRESVSFGKACVNYIREHRNEITCVYANSWPIFSQKSIVKTTKRFGIPCVIHVQDIYPESLTNKLPNMLSFLIKKLVLPLDRYILSNCSHVVAISEKMKSYLSESRGIDPRKMSVVLNWQDESFFLNYNAIAEDRPFTFMYMGNIGPVAGVDLLIDAFVEARLEHARLVIAGSGTMKKSLIERAKGHSGIVFWEAPNGRVPEIQSKADIMLLPIKKNAASSSIPSKLPAYMFSAKPIIGCIDERSDTAEAILAAECGWVIEPENAYTLAVLMKKVASMKSESLKEIGQNALRYGLKHFSKSVNLNKLVNIIISEIDCKDTSYD